MIYYIFTKDEESINQNSNIGETRAIRNEIQTVQPSHRFLPRWMYSQQLPQAPIVTSMQQPMVVAQPMVAQQPYGMQPVY